MSHVSNVALHVKDLDALAKAAASCGCVLNLGQTSYRWFGQHVGDYPLPEGFTARDLGKCDHAISVLDDKGRSYEIGVCKRRDGKPGYQLLWDFWEGGMGLQAKVGNDSIRLRQHYGAEVAAKDLRRKGYRITIKEEMGKLKLQARK